MAALTLAGARRVVVKIGSALLVDQDTGAVRQDWLSGLALDLAEVANGAEVLIVSSGSIALGRRVLNLPAGALPLEQAQAAASVGQIRLARAYQEALEPHGLTAAQILLTLEDTKDRRRYLNASATLKALLKAGAVPVINENDTVATDEIRFGDNDRLAARAASMVGADLLVLLSDIDGLYSGDPRHDPDARFIAHVPEITPEVAAMAGGAASETSNGGMTTKLMAARTATRAGCAMIICQGRALRPLTALNEGARHTVFSPSADALTARKAWIAGMKPEGAIRIDAGARAALMGGKSLLPAGVRAVTGAFQRGDPVAIEGPEGALLGAGLASYDAEEARRIAGRNSSEIEGLLGYPGRAALVHRDDMAV